MKTKIASIRRSMGYLNHMGNLWIKKTAPGSAPTDIPNAVLSSSLIILSAP